MVAAQVFKTNMKNTKAATVQHLEDKVDTKEDQVIKPHQTSNNLGIIPVLEANQVRLRQLKPKDNHHLKFKAKASSKETDKWQIPPSSTQKIKNDMGNTVQRERFIKQKLQTHLKNIYMKSNIQEPLPQRTYKIAKEIAIEAS